MKHSDFERRARIQELLTDELGIPMQKSVEVAIMITDLLYFDDPETRWRVKDHELNCPENYPSPALPVLEQSLIKTMYRIALVQVLLMLGAIVWLVWRS